jgi:hypothetical protein
VARHLSWYDIPEYCFIVKTFSRLIITHDNFAQEDIAAKTARLIIKNVTVLPYFISIVYQKTK